MRKLNLPSFNALVSRTTAWKTLALTCLLGCVSYTDYAQVEVVGPGSAGVTVCPNTAVNGITPAGTTIAGEIRLRENNDADYAAGASQFTVTPPAGWRFTGATPIVSYNTGRDITSVSVVTFNATSLVINVTAPTTTQRDRVEINGLQVQPVNPGGPSGSLTFSLSAGSITGLPVSGVPLSQYAEPGFSAVSGTPNPLCQGTTLNLNSTPTGGSGVYTSFAWNGPGGYSASTEDATYPSIPVLASGVYSVTVTDNQGCMGMGTTSLISVNSNPTISANATPAAVCVGGTVTLTSTPVGGSGSYPTYSWAGPGGFTANTRNTANSNVTPTSAGVYSVTVTDGNGCTSTAPGTTAFVVVNSLPSVFALAVPTNVCEGGNIALSATPSGGSGTYTSYSWTGPDAFTSGAQNTSNTNVTTADAGVYSVTVTDNNNCTSVAGTTASVAVNTNPSISATATPNPLCVGTTLALNSTPSGGSGVYNTFAWNGPNSYTAGTEDASLPSITTAGAGTYSITVTDNNGCIGRGTTSSVVVNTNPTISASATPAAICQGSTLNLNSIPSGGTTPYASFVWTGPAGFFTAGQFATYPSIPLSGSGVYSVTVTDNNGCTGRATTAAVTVNANPTISAIANTPICAGNTLTLNATPAGGSGTYTTFAWTGPNSFTAATEDATLSSITTAGTGTYTVTVTDNNGCTGTGTVGVVVNVNPIITVATATPNPICEGSTLNLIATAGSGSGVYTSYSWNGPAGYTSVAATPGATRAAVTTAFAGVYSVTVTDNNGCVSAPGTTSSVVVNTRPSITASATPNPLCVGATLALNSAPTGGSGVYTSYSWSGPAAYTAATQNATRLNITAGGAGVYSVNVTDNNGCTSAAPGTTAPVVVNALPTITVFANPNPICALRTLSLTATPAGGSGTYSSFLWNGPNGFTSVAQATTVPGITSAGAGIYSVTVTDNNGCTSAIGTTATIVVRNNPTITANATPTPLCVGSTLTLTSTPAGGSGSYTTYSWSGPGGFTAASQNTPRTNIQLTGAGVYSVTVTDNFGCTSTNPGTTPSVVVNDNPAVTASASPNPLCQNSTLTLTSTPTGGSGIYTYAWNGPSGYTATTQSALRTSIPVAGSGVYSITVTDNNGCIGRATTGVVVVNPNPIVTAAAAPTPLCEGSTLNLTSGASSGSGVYTSYSWTGPNSFTAAIQNTTRTAITTADAGVYSVTVTDNNGCSGSGTTASVVVNTNPTISATASPNPICSGTDLNLNSTPAGGSGTYTGFAWNGPNSFSAATQNATYLAIPVAGAGIYSVTVTDNNGCIGRGTTASVVVNASPTITASATPNPICFGNSLSLTSTPVAGSGAITGYSWTGPNSFTATTQNPSIASVTLADNGIFNVTVTDNNGCTASGNVTVTVNPLPLVFNVTGGGGYCSGGTGVTIGLDGSEVGINYELFLGGSSVGFQAGTGSAFSFGSYTTAGGPYTVVATNASTLCTQNMAGGVSVTILPLPAQYNVTGGGSYCSGGTGVSVGLDNSNVGFTYQLFDGATPVGAAVPGTGAAIDFGLQTTATTYTVQATNDFSGCTQVMTGSATVTIIALPTAYNVVGGGTLCEFGTGYHIGLTPASEIGVNYQLYNGSTPVGTPFAGTGGAIDFGVFTAAGTYSVMATSTVTGCSNGMNGSADIFVDPAPVQFSVTGGGDYCVGSTVPNIGLTGSEVGVNYQLFNGSTTVGVVVPGTGFALDFGPQATAGTYTVSATNATTLCTRDMSGSTVVVINPLPQVYTVTGGGNYCFGGNGVAIGLTGSEVGVNYQPILGGSPVGTAAAGTGAAFNIGLMTTAGTYSVVATNATTGCTSNMAGDATVNVDPLPDAYAVTGGGTMCSGGAGFPIGLATSDATADYQLYNGSTPVGAPVTGTGTAFDFGTFTAAGTYSVQATSNTGSGCVAGMIGSATITVNPLPAAISGASSVCTGADITLSSSPAGGTWTSDASFIADVDMNTGVVTGVSAGTAGITYTLPTGCETSVTITVNQTPGAITGNTSLCVGSTTTLSNATAGGTWSNAITAVSIDPVTGVVTGLASGADIITYTVANGCYVTRIETVHPLPFVTPINAVTTVVCVNNTITYTNATIGGTWSSDNTPVASVDPATGVITGITSGTANIIYTFTNGSGCTSSVSQGVTVNPLPGISMITGPTNVCAGATVALVNATPGGVWSSSNTAIATISGSGIVTGIAPGSISIGYTVTNTFGCSSASSYGFTVGNTMPSSAIVPAGSLTLCGGNPVNLSVNSFGTLTSYQWLQNGTPISGANSVSITVTTPGFYEVIIGNGTCEQQIATGVTVIAPPAAVVLYDSVANVLYTGSFNTYQWYFNGNIIAGATSSILTPSGDGVYAVIVTDGNGCADTAVYTMGVPVGVSTQHIADNIRIYPNPATSILYIDAPAKVFVSVLSADGKMLIERKEAISINVSQLADGMYMIMIYNENNTLLKTGKFMKMQ